MKQLNKEYTLEEIFTGKKYEEGGEIESQTKELKELMEQLEEKVQETIGYEISPDFRGEPVARFDTYDVVREQGNNGWVIGSYLTFGQATNAALALKNQPTMDMLKGRDIIYVVQRSSFSERASMKDLKNIINNLK